MKLFNINDVLFYNMRTIIEDDGSLVVIESNSDVPFIIKRTFYIYNVRENDVRGEHAHYKTKQLLICINGKVEVKCHDGKREKKFLLDSPNRGLYVPESIWDEQRYLTKDSGLLVLANTKYDASDYIQSFDKFLKLRK